MEVMLKSPCVNAGQERICDEGQGCPVCREYIATTAMVRCVTTIAMSQDMLWPHDSPFRFRDDELMDALETAKLALCEQLGWDAVDLDCHVEACCE